MREAVDLHDRDVVIAEQLNHSLDELRHEQRHVAARHVRDLDVCRQRLEPGAQAFERASAFAFVARDR